MSEASGIAPWGLVYALRDGVRQLFPTRRTKIAMWGLVMLGVVITYLELTAAQLFSNLITNLDGYSATRTTLVFSGFLLAFVAVRGVSYFQSVFRLTVFEKALRQVPTGSRAAEAWRWPMAISLVGMMGQIARLAMVTIKVGMIDWLYGGLLAACTGIAVLIVNRTGRSQYKIHHQFVAAKKAGQPPSAGERIGTRIRAGERAGLIAIGPVLLFVVALGLGAAQGRIAAHSAIVFFIAGRMAGNMYGGLANASLRYIRAQVNVETYGGGRSSRSGHSQPAIDIDEKQVRALLTSGGYLSEPPAQAFARSIDDGRVIGDLETIGRASRSAGAGPQQGLRQHLPAARPERIVAIRPNQVWVHDAYAAPCRLGSPSACLHIVTDIFSRLIVHWKLTEVASATEIQTVRDEALRVEGLEPSLVDFVSMTRMVGQLPSLYDMLRDLGVARTLLWASPEGTQPSRPRFPTRFDDEADLTRWIGQFVDWHNNRFYQPAIGYQHPADVHYGRAAAIVAHRRRTLEEWALTAEFPVDWALPEESWVPYPRIVTVRRDAADAEFEGVEDEEGP